MSRGVSKKAVEEVFKGKGRGGGWGRGWGVGQMSESSSDFNDVFNVDYDAPSIKACQKTKGLEFPFVGNTTV